MEGSMSIRRLTESETQQYLTERKEVAARYGLACINMDTLSVESFKAEQEIDNLKVDVFFKHVESTEAEQRISALSDYLERVGSTMHELRQLERRWVERLQKEMEEAKCS